MTDPILVVRNLSIDARTPEGLRPVLENVSFALQPSETLCLAGESGSGKSLTALAIMRLLSPSLKRRDGSIVLDGRELTTLPERAMRGLRGGAVAMIFQEPMTSLNPVMTVGAQLTEAIRAHGAAAGGGAEARARAMLDAVHITDPARRLSQYPHELSGGMRQRVMIAMALSCRPKVLIADEPTTALDVTVQAQILRLVRELKAEFGTAVVLITHDMGVVGQMADRVLILNKGRVVEEGTASAVLHRPEQPYTRQLLAAVPRLGAHAGTDAPPRVTEAPPVPVAPGPVLFVRDLSVTYGRPAGLFRRRTPGPTVAGIGFTVKAGETLGLVGESGSGKSTVGKAVLGLVPFVGEVVIDGQAIAGLAPRAMKPVRRVAQMIFQDPYASLDPRMSIGGAIAEPLAIHGIGNAGERRDRVAALLRRVHLPADAASRYPHEFSGGQRQRLCIARALALEPKLIVADESVSALDVSVRAHVLDLMAELQEELGLAYLFISHDMAVIERMSHHVAVMRGGAIVEQGPRRSVFEAPQHAYTRALMEAVPTFA
ncbi:ABC transporter ATP-binding protein [Lichenihabitans sp. Uapishka_5]|uniref:ABC transporter ATP-binding protein n=1 Tax=Lichenihabitans sp. Uapishka_5 TaxID=3037302 RepID=UPI0029E7FB9A|nr:ABC transporter ATP-binding protein [Lichenihabitans sp. Uapishka_5]MDX7950590.1 ABC transporter ATP-binding protein [Lichenihabitans sp. Uapishka_5]